MSALSFVALSMQTTHLDPATVNKASYLKLVDGNITRHDAIHIIPPASQANASPDSPAEAVSWEEALSQLSMVVGKLPIVSYYRDADKEIFQAASRRSGVTPPEFQWLDCRALARQLLPDLPEHQLSTVLKTLGIYDEYADRSAVEQTAEIVLQLANSQGATTVHELWGELYDQPDELLDLESTLEGITALETYSDDGASELEKAVKSPALNGSTAAGGAAIAVSADPAEKTPVEPEDSEPEKRQGPQEHEPAVETDQYYHEEYPSQIMDLRDIGATEDEESEEELGSPDTDEDPLIAPLSDDHGDSFESPAADPADSTAQSVIATEHLDQPEFLRISDDEEDYDRFDSEKSHDQQTGASDVPVDDLLAKVNARASNNDPEPDTVLPESHEAGAFGPDTTPIDQQPQLQHEDADNEPIETLPASSGHDEDAPFAAATTPVAEDAALPAVEHSAHTRPFDPVNQIGVPDREIHTGSTSWEAITQPVAAGQDQWAPVEEPRRRRSKARRVWGILGLILFGLLTVLGLVLTVMAVLLFFTSNNLLLETKIAGVVLTSAITLLSLLMAVLSYRSFRKK